MPRVTRSGKKKSTSKTVMNQSDNLLANNENVDGQPNNKILKKEVNLLNGQYSIVKQIRRGTNGPILLASVTCLDNNEVREIRKIYLDEINENELIENIFQQDLILQKLKHENIIRYYEHFCKESFLYIVTEYCECDDLGSYLTTHNDIDQNRIIDWFLQISMGLNYLHENNYVHRNLKPENIFLRNEFKSIKLGDSGISSKNENSVSDARNSSYISPEISKNVQHDDKCDIWSLGVVLYELCTNKLPFQSKEEVFEKETPALPVKHENLNFPLENLLKKNPAERWDTNQILKWLETNRKSDEKINTIGDDKNTTKEPAASNNVAKETKIHNDNVYDSEPTPVPTFHYKCRYDSKDSNCSSSDLYTRTTDIHRFEVPKTKIKWRNRYPQYKPVNFTAEKILNRKPGDYKDPSENDVEYSDIKFNEGSKKSHHGTYHVEKSLGFSVEVPHNPVGRTGLIGRGHLGKWGPNHAADPVVTRWKRDENKNKVIDPKTNLPVLQFIGIQRRDTKEWAIPGGMVEPDEYTKTTAAREFAEEVLSKEFDYITSIVNHKAYSIITESNEFQKKFNEFFTEGKQIYRGYVDDPRNTDNAWMETVVYNFHDENNEFVGELELKGGSDAEAAKWIDLDSSLKLYASHSEFINKVAVLHNSHW